MAQKAGTLGAMLQGVSQQPERVRLYGQVGSQVNLVSDVAVGLTTRPASTDGPQLAGAEPAMRFTDLVYKGQDYIVGWDTGVIRAWDLEGNAVPITGDQSYIGRDMLFHVVGNEIICVNRDTVVEKSDQRDGPTWRPALFHCLGGEYGMTFEIEATITINGVRTVTRGSYKAPMGSGDNDADKTSADYIIQQIVTQLRAANATPNPLPPTCVVNNFGDVATMFCPGASIELTAKDGQGGELLRVVTSTAKDPEQLPRFAPNGAVVRITQGHSAKDDFWLQFHARGEYPMDGEAGFGVPGVWREHYNPAEDRYFQLGTMPHVIESEGAGLTIRPGSWIPRPVGDSVTAPYPSLVGHPIRDICGFEGRIVLLSPETVVMSRTDKPFDLWRETATGVVATDPVDITSTKKDSLRLDWLVPFDRDLFVIADPGDSQFLIRGGGIDPRTVGMVLTTEFVVQSAGARPSTTGRTILLPFTQGEFSGIKEFYTDRLGSNNVATGLTESTPRYLNGKVRHVEVSQNFNMACIGTTADLRTLFTYKYLWEDRELRQSAWSQWTFRDEAVHWFFRSSVLWLVSRTAEHTALHSLDLNKPADLNTKWHIMLDRKRVVRLDADHRAVLAYPGARFLQGRACPAPGTEAMPLSARRVAPGEYLYEFGSEFANGAELVSGQEVPWELRPTRPYGRDHRDEIDVSQRITVQWWAAHVDSSGPFVVSGESPYLGRWEWYDPVFQMDAEPLDPDRTGLYSGVIRVPWGHRADEATVTLHGNGMRPVTILELEWSGQVIKSSLGRRT